MISLVLALVGITLLALKPRAAALGMVFMAIAFEDGAPDFTEPVGSALYNLDPTIASLLPGTIEPIGLFAIALSLRLGLSPAPADRIGAWSTLPRAIWLVPGVYFLSIAWGLANGGALNFAFHESRGLLVAAAVFIATRRVAPFEAGTVIRLIYLATATLAVIMIYRYTFVPVQYDAMIVAHENVMFLAIGITVGILQFAGSRSVPQRAALLLLITLLLVGTLATGKRSGTLVVLISLVVMSVILLSRAPVKVMVISGIFGVLFGAYVAAFWGSNAGILGQPARAIRSQFQPSARDSSSDLYRQAETFNVVYTIKGTPLLGVGLGRPYNVYWPTWVAPNWPLQFYTPHDNLLWFWLKFGLPGLAVIGGVWLLAVSNAISAVRARPRAFPVYPVALAATLMIYLQFMQVDVATKERSMIPLGIAMALALSLPQTVPAGAREQSAIRLVTAEPQDRRRYPRYFPGAV